jgi:MoaA/NifB/PqqE/SkfB family radical SAM enzyme
MKPNEKNFCGGNFEDWLEVMLTPRCNGKCSWCVEKKGYHPKKHADWLTITKTIIKAKKKNIILLGGEPTLYKDIKPLIQYLVKYKLNVYITTNGSMLSKEFVMKNLTGIKGINISMHSEFPDENINITGIGFNLTELKETIEFLHSQNTVVRLNCNLIKKYVDSRTRINQYLKFAKALKVDSVRFAELKEDEDNFVDLYKLYKGKYGTNNEPFGLGCNHDVVINGMPVNFRQMCGDQTCKRKMPLNPERVQRKTVIYYDGKIYDGWQRKEDKMNKEKAKKTAEQLEKQLKKAQDKISKLKEELERAQVGFSEEIDCQY